MTIVVAILLMVLLFFAILAANLISQRNAARRKLKGYLRDQDDEQYHSGAGSQERRVKVPKDKKLGRNNPLNGRTEWYPHFLMIERHSADFYVFATLGLLLVIEWGFYMLLMAVAGGEIMISSNPAIEPMVYYIISISIVIEKILILAGFITIALSVVALGLSAHKSIIKETDPLRYRKDMYNLPDVECE